VTNGVRLQLSRRAGFNLQKLSRATNGLPAVSVARPGRLGNPFVVAPDVGGHMWRVVGPDGRTLAVCAARPAAHGEAVAFFRAWLLEDAQAALRELGRATIAGRPSNVACWCAADWPCHGDVWLEVVGA
jgi:hypothetical protein